MSTRKNQIIIYQARTGALELYEDYKNETIWATQNQIAKAFEVDVRTVNEHLKNIFNTSELDENSVIRKFRITAADGKSYLTNHYNLDAMISVGYRVNSKKATKFRQWATKTLHQHIVQGYTINKKRIKYNNRQFFQSVDDIRKLLEKESRIDSKNVLDLVSIFADTWLSLEAYDTNSFPKVGTTKEKFIISKNQLYKDLQALKANLLKKGHASDIFALEKVNGSLEGILGNVLQSFEGKELYSTVEEKAANLLYFIVKDHPFIDGNKRGGAFAFVWFLNQTKTLNVQKITPTVLTPLTLLIAQSNPKDKDRMVGLILRLLGK